MQILALLASFVGSAYAFADTAPLFAVPAISQQDFQYITESHYVSQSLKDYSAQLCAQKDQKLFFYRIGSLNYQQKQDLGADFTHIRHVHYKSASDLDFELHPSCTVEHRNTCGDYSQTEANVVIVDLGESIIHDLNALLNHKNVIVQVKPTFNADYCHVDSTKEFLDEEMHLNLEHRSGRLDESDVQFKDGFAEEFDDVFRAANALFLANKDKVEEIAANKHKSNHNDKRQKNKTSNLFTEYQFFTPGVWLSIIISLCLVCIAFTAIDWITSIQLSYKSFERKIDYEKKNE